eukprot:Gb_17962 [translate_table: standard]
MAIAIPTILAFPQHQKHDHCNLYEQIYSPLLRNEKKRKKIRLFVEFFHQSKNQTATNTIQMSGATHGGTGGKRNGRSVRKLIKVGLLTEALELLHVINPPSIWVDTNVYASLLQTCIDLKAWREGMRVHAYIIKTGFKSVIFLDNTLVTMYVKCGRLLDAHQMFDKMSKRNRVSWTALIAGYAQNGFAEEALSLFFRMQCAGMKPNEFTFVSVVKALGDLQSLEKGKQVHGYIIKIGCDSNLYLESALVDLYAKCGNMVDAFQVFDAMSERDVVSWTAMIAGCAQQQRGEEALKLFYEMQREGVAPNQFTVSSLLKACAWLNSLKQGKQVHAAIIRTGVRPDVYVGSALVDMYVKCGSVLDARQVFDRMHKRNNVSWTAMIAGYAHNGLGEEAIALFHQMQGAGIRPCEFALVSILRACARLGALKRGKQVHARIIKNEFDSNTYLGSTLVGLYGKCGNLAYAGQVFKGMPVRDVVSWTALIAGYAQQGYGKEALVLLTQMLQEGVKPNQFTFASILRACAGLEALEQGKQIHGSISKTQFESYVFVGSALVDMYSKCGSLVDAHQVFDRMPVRNAVSWNTIIVGYLKHGYSREALKLLYQMREAGMEPEEFIIVSVLNACGSPHSIANNSISTYSEMDST